MARVLSIRRHLPGVRRQRSGHADRRPDEVQCSCPRCHGTGKNISTCPNCHGEGTVERTEPLEVRIKAGTRDGQRIRLAGKGNAGAHGGPAGDLYAIIRTADHPVFHREGDDIRITVPVSATEAALGAKIEVPTIDGRTLLKIPPGTQIADKSFACAKKACPRPPKKALAAMRSSKSNSPSLCPGTSAPKKSCENSPS